MTPEGIISLVVFLMVSSAALLAIRNATSVIIPSDVMESAPLVDQKSKLTIFRIHKPPTASKPSVAQMRLGCLKSSPA